MSICPKNKSSKSHRDKRCGALMVPHRVCAKCGSYNKKEIIQVED